MAFSSAPIVVPDGKITVYDGAGSPLSEEVRYEEGNLNFTGMNQGFMDVTVFDDRGRPYAIRRLKSRSIPFTFSCHALSFTGGLMAACYKVGTWASATSTLPVASGGSEVFCLKMVFEAERSNFGASVTDSTVTFLICRVDSADFAEGNPATFTIKGEAYLFADTDITLAG